MFRDQRVALIIPALDEAETIASVVSSVDRLVVDEIIVADNGSQDATAELARAAGALVVLEPRQGYGSACLAAIRKSPAVDIIVFMDGDGSDDPAEIEKLLETMITHDAALVIGSRVKGEAEKGSLTPAQRFGNSLTCGLVLLFWGVRFSDLGPFRAIRRQDLQDLAMRDPDFGWTIEMQVKAAQRKLKVVETPVKSRLRQGGKSKVSGTLTGSFRAGKRILSYVFEAKAREWFGASKV